MALNMCDGGVGIVVWHDVYPPFPWSSVYLSLKKPFDLKLSKLRNSITVAMKVKKISWWLFFPLHITHDLKSDQYLSISKFISMQILTFFRVNSLGLSNIQKWRSEGFVQELNNFEWLCKDQREQNMNKDSLMFIVQSWRLNVGTKGCSIQKA